MKFRVWTGVVWLLAGGLAGCGEGTPSVTLSGSSTIAPVVLQALEAFEAQHPGIKVDVQTGGSSRGIADATLGRVDIGMTSRALKPEETPGLTQHVLARDGVGFVVHADNPVTGLTREQARGIYRGSLTRWSQVGGADTPIVVINRPEGRSELDLVGGFLGLKASEMKADVVAGENQQAVKQVSGNPDAVVYLSVGTAAYEAAAGTALKPLALDGVDATVQTVASGAFPLGRPLVLVTRDDAPLSDEAQAFLDYLLSPQVDAVLREHSFVAPPR